MATKIRPELSEKNKYYIDKHRHYELKHFCLQYPIWRKQYAAYSEIGPNLSKFEQLYSDGMKTDLTAKLAIKRAYYAEKIELIEKAAAETDYILSNYILKAVTEGLSYPYLKTVLHIPCGRDVYYERYRKFFWILDYLRD